jgi:hypothetical protein
LQGYIGDRDLMGMFEAAKRLECFFLHNAGNREHETEFGHVITLYIVGLDK